MQVSSPRTRLEPQVSEAGTAQSPQRMFGYCGSRSTAVGFSTHQLPPSSLVVNEHYLHTALLENDMESVT